MKYLIQNDWDIILDQDGTSYLWYKRIEDNNKVSGGKLIVNSKIDVKCTLGDDFFKFIKPKTCQIINKISNYSEIFVSPSKHISDIANGSLLLSIDVNFDGTFAAYSTSNNKLTFFNIKTGIDIAKFDVGSFTVTSVKFAPSGTILMTSGYDMELKIWWTNKMENVACFKPGNMGAIERPCDLNLEPGGHSARIEDFSFLERGKNICAFDTLGFIRFWDTSSQGCYFSCQIKEGIELKAILAIPLALTGNKPSQYLRNFNFSSNQKYYRSDLKNNSIILATTSGLVIIDEHITSYLTTQIFENVSIRCLCHYENWLFCGCEDGSISTLNLNDINNNHGNFSVSNKPITHIKCLKLAEVNGIFIFHAMLDGVVRCVMFDLNSLTIDPRKSIQYLGSDCYQITGLSLIEDFKLRHKSYLVFANKNASVFHHEDLNLEKLYE